MLRQGNPAVVWQQDCVWDLVERLLLDDTISTIVMSAVDGNHEVLSESNDCRLARSMSRAAAALGIAATTVSGKCTTDQILEWHSPEMSEGLWHESVDAQDLTK